MLAILLHSSKTMRAAEPASHPYQRPALLEKSETLATYLRELSASQLASAMQLSPVMAEKTRSLVESWSVDPANARPALDAFLGDIYSGLQVQTFSEDDRRYANDHLFILSGLYGILRALDSIHPYRLEMGYRLPDEPFRNLYTFWQTDLAAQLPPNADIVNLSAVEYTKALLPHLPHVNVVTPKFLTVSPKTGEPVFVTVHAKIARGAFARWLIQRRVDDLSHLHEFDQLGYSFDQSRSTPEQPVFVASEFKGLGLSVRLS